MRHLFRLSVPVAIAALGLLVAACGGANPTATPVPTSTQPPRTPTATLPPAATPQATATLQPVRAPTPQPMATPAPTATNTPAPVPDSEMRVALALINFNLLPDQTGERRWQDPLYDQVVNATPDGALQSEGGVAESWVVSADSKTWTFRMRKGVFFSNRVEATSKDFKWTLDFHSRPEATQSQAFYLRDRATIEATDASTIIVGLKNPDFNFARGYLTSLGSGAYNYLLPKDYMESIGPQAFNKAPIGSGPYKLKTLTLGSSIAFEAVENHWYYGKPKFRTLQFLQVTEETARVALLKSGRVEIAELGRPRGAEMRKAGFNVFVKEGSNIGYVVLHEQHKLQYDGVPNPLGNVKVREALNLAVDRQTIVDTFLNGLATPTINYPVVSWDPAYQKLPLPQFDPARARQLLNEAGYPKGFELELAIYPFRGLDEGPEVMEGVAVWWEQIGIKINRAPTDYAAFRDIYYAQRLRKPTASGVLFVSNRIVATVLAAADRSAGSRSFEDSELEALGARWRATRDEQEYISVGRLVQQKYAEKWVQVTLFQAGETFATDPKAVPSWNLGKWSLSLRINSVAAGK